MVENGNKVSFNKRGCYIYNAQNDCIGEASLENNLYRLNTVKSEPILAVAVLVDIDNWVLWTQMTEKMRHKIVKDVT